MGEGVTARKPRSRRAQASRNERGSAEDRRRRREWLLETWRVRNRMAVVTPGPNSYVWTWVVKGIPVPAAAPVGSSLEPVCRCWHCGDLLTIDTLTVDRITPGCEGGTYRRDNIRPACARCNNELGQPSRA